MLDRLLQAWQTAEPFDAVVLSMAVIGGLWVLVDLARAAWTRRHDDWPLSEGGIRR